MKETQVLYVGLLVTALATMVAWMAVAHGSSDVSHHRVRQGPWGDVAIATNITTRAVAGHVIITLQYTNAHIEHVVTSNTWHKATSTK